MNLWIPAVVLAIIGLVAIAAAVRMRRRRTNRLQLRVLAGRRRLLGEEITQRCQRLGDLDPEELDADRRSAEGALDQIHIRLLDREAHLQNLDDLTRLQRHKLAILARRHQQLASVAQAELVATEGDDARPNDDDAGILERRERLQDKLLEHIQEHGQEPPKRTRRPGRRR